LLYFVVTCLFVRFLRRFSPMVVQCEHRAPVQVNDTAFAPPSPPASEERRVSSLAAVLAGPGLRPESGAGTNLRR
jgi:hypothetical protein